METQKAKFIPFCLTGLQINNSENTKNTVSHIITIYNHTNNSL